MNIHLIGIAVLCQLVLLGYHQITTLFDFYPFNGARHLKPGEKWAECGVNWLLVALPPLGFAFRLRGLMIFGLIYYFVLFGVELIIWWIPYLTVPSAPWRVVYNRLLSWTTSNFQKRDTVCHWRRLNKLDRCRSKLVFHKGGYVVSSRTIFASARPIGGRVFLGGRLFCSC